MSVATSGSIHTFNTVSWPLRRVKRTVVSQFKFLTNLPYVGSGIRRLWRRYLYYRTVLHWRRNVRRHDRVAPVDPFRLYWVSPTRVTQKVSSQQSKQFNWRRDTGRVLGGDWDEKRRDIQDSSRNRMLVARFEDRCSWEETEYFLKKLEQIERGQSEYYTSKANLYDKYERLDEVYESLREEGYRAQQSIHDTRTIEALEEITVHIDRDGTLLFRGVGFHRLALAHILNLEEVLVRVVVRHKQWQLKRDAIATGEASPKDFGLDSNHPDISPLL